MSPLILSLLVLIPLVVLLLSWLLLSRRQEAEQLRLRTELELAKGVSEQLRAREHGYLRELAELRQALQASAAAEAAAGARLTAVQQRHAELQDELRGARTTSGALEGELQQARLELARLGSEREGQQRRFDEQQAFLLQMKAEMEREFRRIASASLEQQGGQLREQQQERLAHTLNPFREQLEAFRRQVDERFGTEAEGRASLKGELTRMLELNQTLSRQTENLTQALSRSSRHQGAYGEDVLETILSNAGMLEGEHYYRQHTTQNVDGQRIRPDIIIRRPEGVSIVVDSKVSLTHYLRYCEPGQSPESELALRREVYASFRAHIDGLSGKKYDTIEGTADFVLLFTPVENAYTVATNHDPNLRAYAFSKNVFVVTPSSLLLVVKMISDLWQKDRVKRSVQEMAELARRMYEKASLFVSSFEALGKSLERARTDWEQAAARLDGHGGMLSQGKKLEKMLGNMTTKQLPERLSP